MTLCTGQGMRPTVRGQEARGGFRKVLESPRRRVRVSTYGTRPICAPIMLSGLAIGALRRGQLVQAKLRRTGGCFRRGMARGSGLARMSGVCHRLQMRLGRPRLCGLASTWPLSGSVGLSSVGSFASILGAVRLHWVKRLEIRSFCSTLCGVVVASAAVPTPICRLGSSRRRLSGPSGLLTRLSIFITAIGSWTGLHGFICPVHTGRSTARARRRFCLAVSLMGPSGACFGDPTRRLPISASA